MSVFLKARKRIDDVNISKKLKPYYRDMLLKCHNFFTEKNLLNVFDMENYFDMFLFKGESEYFGENPPSKVRKLKIRHSENILRDINPFSKLKFEYGGFFPNKNKIIVYRPTRKAAKINNSLGVALYDHYLRVLTHEFVHFLTVSYFATKKVDGNATEVADEEDYWEFMYAEHWLEAFTEKMALEILGVADNPAYAPNKIALDFIAEVFDISYVNFLSRNFNSMKPYISESSYEKIDKYLYDLHYLPQEHVEKHTTTMMLLTKVVLETYKYKVLLTKENITIKDFINKQIEIADKIPYKSLISYKHEFNEINKIFVSEILKRNNVLPSSRREEKLLSKINDAINNGVEEKLAYGYRNDIEVGTTINIGDQALTFYKKVGEDKICLINHFEKDYMQRNPEITELFNTNDEDYKNREIKVRFGNVYLYKVKNKPIKILENKNTKLKNLIVNQRKRVSSKKKSVFTEQANVYFNNNSLKIYTNNNNKITVMKLDGLSINKQHNSVLEEIGDLIKTYKTKDKELAKIKKQSKTKLQQTINKTKAKNKEKDSTKKGKKEVVYNTPNFVLLK